MLVGDEMKNLFVSNLHEKDVENFTSDFGLRIRRKVDKPFKKLCNMFTKAHIIRNNDVQITTDEEYFCSLDTAYIPHENYSLSSGKNNIIVERYPKLNDNEPYIFVCNHTCPEDIETVLNILDRNAYLVLGSVESLQYNPEMYLSWLNGMIPFDIMNKEQRKCVFDKMLRVLKTNSILIFPEGSHNYSPNNLVNPLFDGPVNLALQTGRKIVVVTMLKDQENNISYIDVSNPVDVHQLDVNLEKQFQSEKIIEKHYVNRLSSLIRDKMATAVYYMMSRHFQQINRSDYINLEENLRIKKIQDAFKKLKWDRDVFDAEYLVKKTSEDKKHEEVVRTLSNLVLNPNALKGFSHKPWVLCRINLENKDVPNRMRQHWKNTQQESEYVKVLKKKNTL